MPYARKIIYTQHTLELLLEKHREVTYLNIADLYFIADE